MANDNTKYGKFLLSDTNRVEVPFIKVTIGNYTFGAYSEANINPTSYEGFFKKTGIQYPNYVQKLEVTKINGQVNEYVLNLTYPIRPGDDPNFFEKVFSSVSQSRKIEFSYGDMSSPEYIYRREQAVITSVGTAFDLTTARINYTVKAISSAFLGYSTRRPFEAWFGKPSERIYWLLNNPDYGLKSLFYGMTNVELVKQLDLIAGDDKEVQLKRKDNMTSLDYLKYLISCMIPDDELGTTNISKTFYILTIHDEAENETIKNISSRELGGPYFKVEKVSKNVDRPDAYELTIGYPTGTLVTSFGIQNNENYSIYYDWQGSLSSNDYVERIDNQGNIERVYSPVITSGNATHSTKPDDITWWTKVTQYPISATITIWGLLRPALLMDYIRLTVLFHGKKHISSGLYIITKQVDTIDGGGYKTVLSMTKVNGDPELEVGL